MYIKIYIGPESIYFILVSQNHEWLLILKLLCDDSLMFVNYDVYMYVYDIQSFI